MTKAMHTDRRKHLVLGLLMVMGHSTLALAGITMDQINAAGQQIAAAPCAQPEAVRREPRVNRHNPRNTDQMIFTDCTGIRVEHYQVKESGRLFVQKLRLSAPDPRLPAELQPGQPVTPARKLLGEPTAPQTGSLRYLLPGEPGTDHFSVESGDGRIQALVWTWRVD